MMHLRKENLGTFFFCWQVEHPTAKPKAIAVHEWCRENVHLDKLDHSFAVVVHLSVKYTVQCFQTKHRALCLFVCYSEVSPFCCCFLWGFVWVLFVQGKMKVSKVIFSRFWSYLELAAIRRPRGKMWIQISLKSSAYKQTTKKQDLKWAHGQVKYESWSGTHRKLIFTVYRRYCTP